MVNGNRMLDARCLMRDEIRNSKTATELTEATEKLDKKNHKKTIKKPKDKFECSKSEPH